VTCLQLLNHLSKAFIMSLKQPSSELEVTMVVSSRTLELMSCVMTLELDINSRPSTLHNRMALLRGRIEHSLI
jgi:hypothetical protein